MMRPSRWILLLALAAPLAGLTFTRLARHTDIGGEPHDLLRTTLRDLATAEELSIARSGSLAHPDELADFRMPDGVRLVHWRADSLSWQATLEHEASGVVCSQRAAEQLEAATCSEPDGRTR